MNEEMQMELYQKLVDAQMQAYARSLQDYCSVRWHRIAEDPCKGCPFDKPSTCLINNPNVDWGQL
jgi:hypothetical protein